MGLLGAARSRAGGVLRERSADIGEDALALCDFVEAVCPHRRRDLARVLASAACNAKRLRRTIDRLLDRAFEAAPFPPAPFPASGELLPLGSGSALRDEGRRMRSCVGQFAREVVEDQCYFYRWRGSEPATIATREAIGAMVREALRGGITGAV